MQNFLTNPLPALRQLLVSGSAAIILLLLLACSVDAQQLAGAAVAQQEASAATATPTNLTIATWGEYNATQQNLPTNLYDVVAVAAGYEHSVALKRDGTVVSWGQTPPAPAGLNNVVAIAAGRYGTLALKNDGTLVAWGSANFGQLDIPAGLSGVVGMAMGDLHSVAVKQDGTVVVWGRGFDPKLKAPAGLRDVVAVSASAEHNLALKRDGTVVAWGQSFSLGLQVPAGLHGVVAIAAGSNLDVALKSDGTVVTWGSADNLINPPAGLTDVIAIDVDQYHAVALKRDGTLVKWGYTYLLNNPAYVKGVSAVALGYGHTLALLSDTTAPETTLVRGPASPNPNAATFEFGGTDDLLVNRQTLRFECSINGGGFTACANPASLTGLPGGVLNLAVRAKDAAGNVDASPTTYTWTQCGDAIDVGDEAALSLGLLCFKQRTTPGIFTIRMTGDIALSATPVAENSSTSISLLIDGQNHTWHGQGRALNGLHVKPGATVSVQNLVIRNAYSQINQGGAIYNQGKLTLDQLTLEGNHSPVTGGGIGNHGTLTVRNSTIRNGYAYGSGGGIGNWAGTATIENSLITGNYAYFGGGLYTHQGATTNLNNVIFGANRSAQGGEITTSYGGILNGAPTYVPTCYWLENVQTGQVLTIPNQSSTPGTALVAAAKQTPTNGHQLWLRRADNALVSLPTGQLVTLQGGATTAMTPSVIETETPSAASQHWDIPNYMGGFYTFGSLLNGYYLSPVDQTAEQTPVVLRHPDDFRYNNWQNDKNLWWMVEAPPTHCLAAMPVSAASAEQAPAISEIEAPASLDQLPADALEKFNAALQPEAVTAAEPNTPPAEQPVQQDALPTQQIFLPLVSN